MTVIDRVVWLEKVIKQAISYSAETLVIISSMCLNVNFEYFLNKGDSKTVNMHTFICTRFSFIHSTTKEFGNSQVDIILKRHI